MPVTIQKKPSPQVCPSDVTYKKIIGLDVSTKTGMAVLSASAAGLSVVATEKVKTDPSKWKGKPRMQRWDHYVQALRRLIDEHHPDMAYIEGYGFSFKSSGICLIEIGTLLRLELDRAGIPWVEVPATVLKKFVTGKGGADKNVMLLECFKRFGFDTNDDDLCDAVCLGYLAASANGYPVDLPALNRDAAAPYGLQLIAPGG